MNRDRFLFGGWNTHHELWGKGARETLRGKPLAEWLVGLGHLVIPRKGRMIMKDGVVGLTWCLQRGPKGGEATDGSLGPVWEAGDKRDTIAKQASDELGVC